MIRSADVNDCQENFAQKIYSQESTIFRFEKKKSYYASCFIPESGLYLFGDDKGFIDIYQDLNKNPIKTINAHQYRITHLLYDGENRILLSASVDGMLVRWSLDEFTPLFNNQSVFAETIISIVVSAFGDKIIVATESGWIKMFDAQLQEIKSQKIEESIKNMILIRKNNILIISSQKKLWFMDADKAKIISNKAAPWSVDKLTPKDSEEFYLISVGDSKLMENLVYKDLDESKIYKLNTIFQSTDFIIHAFEIHFLNALLISTNNSLGILFPLNQDTLFLELVNFKPSFPQLSCLYYNEPYRFVIYCKLDNEIVLLNLNSKFRLLAEYIKQSYIENEISQTKITPSNISFESAVIYGIQKVDPVSLESNQDHTANANEDNYKGLHPLNLLKNTLPAFESILQPNPIYSKLHRKSLQNHKIANLVTDNQLIPPFLVSYEKILPFRSVKLSFPIDFNIFGVMPSIYSITLQKTLLKKPFGYHREDTQTVIQTTIDSAFSNLFFDDILKSVVVISRDSHKIDYLRSDSLALIESYKHTVSENCKLYYSCEKMLYAVDNTSDSESLIQKIAIQNMLTFRKLKCNFRIKKLKKMPYSSVFYAISEEKEVYEISLLKNSIVKVFQSREDLSDLDISPLAEYLLVYSSDKFHIFKLHDRSHLKTVDFESDLIKYINFTYYSDYLVILDASNKYVYYSISQDKIVFGGRFPPKFVNSFVITTSRIIGSLSADSGSIVLWDPHLIFKLDNDSISLYSKNLEKIEKTIQTILNEFLEGSKNHGCEFALESFYRNISYLYNLHSELVVSQLDQMLRRMLVKISELQATADSREVNRYIFPYKAIFHLIESLEILELFPLVFQMSTSEIVMLKCFSFLIFQPFEAMLGKKLDLKQLIQLIDDNDPVLMLVFIEIIEKYKDPKYYYLIEKGIFETTDELKIKAIKAALNLKLNQFALVLQTDLDSGNPSIKRAVLEYLVEFGSSVHFEKIIETIIKDAKNGQSLELYLYFLPKLIKKYPKFLINLDIAANAIADKKPQEEIKEIIKRFRAISN